MGSSLHSIQGSLHEWLRPTTHGGLLYTMLPLVLLIIKYKIRVALPNIKIAMKKLHIILFVASFIIPSISFASIDANLKYGSRGLGVTELQDFLIEKGFLMGQSSGNFFSLTRKAVVAYQTSIGLPATGYVGPMTRAKINDDLSQANASSVSAEIKETGTITATVHTDTSPTAVTPTQTNTTTPSLVSGCSSTTGFSSITGSSCSSVTTSVTPAINKTFTLPNGSVVEVDANGSIVRFVTATPLLQTTPVISNIPTSTASNTSLSFVSQNPTVFVKQENAPAKVVVSSGSVDFRHSTPYKSPGLKDYLFAEVKIKSDKKVFLNSIAWYSAGSNDSFSAKYDSGDPVYSNFGTYVGGIKYTMDNSNGMRYWTASLGGIALNPGEEKVISLKSDLRDIICINRYGCQTETGVTCKEGKVCPKCKDIDAIGVCDYPMPGQTINFDINKAIDISIVDESGKTIVPSSESSQCASSPEGMVCDRSTPWYNGYTIMMEQQPPRP